MLDFEEMRRAILLIEKEKVLLQNILAEYTLSKNDRRKGGAPDKNSKEKNLTHFTKCLIDVSNNGGLLLKIEQESFKKLILEILGNKNIEAITTCYQNSSFENQKKIENIVGRFVFEKFSLNFLKKNKSTYFNVKENVDFLTKTIDFFKTKKEFCNVFKGGLDYYSLSKKEALKKPTNNFSTLGSVVSAKNIYFPERKDEAECLPYIYHNTKWFCYWENLNYFFKNSNIFKLLLSAEFNDPLVESFRVKNDFQSVDFSENAIYSLQKIKKNFNLDLFSNDLFFNERCSVLNFIKLYPEINEEQSKKLFQIIENSNNLTKKEEVYVDAESVFNPRSLFVSYTLLKDAETKKFNENMSYNALSSIICGFLELYREYFYNNNADELNFEISEKIKDNKIMEVFFNKLFESRNLKMELISQLSREVKNIDDEKAMQHINVLKGVLTGNSNILGGLVSCCSVDSVKKAFSDSATGVSSIFNVFSKIKELKIEDVGDLFYPNKFQIGFDKENFLKSCVNALPKKSNVQKFYLDKEKKQLRFFIDFLVDENIRHINNPFYWVLLLLKEENILGVEKEKEISVFDLFNSFSDEEMSCIMLKRSVFYEGFQEGREKKKASRF